MMWWPIHAINLNLLLVKGRSDYFLKLEIIKKTYGIIILLITLPLGLTIFCIGRIISSIISLIVNTYYTGKLINLGFFKQMKDLLPSLLLSFLIFTISLAITYIIPNMILQILIGGLLGIGLYIAMAFLMKMEELKDIIYLLKRK